MAEDFAASGRTDEYHCYLVDPFTLSQVDEVDFAADGTSVTYDYESSNSSGAKIKLADGTDYRRGGKSYMLRLVDFVTLPSGAQYSDVLGTFFADNCASTSLYGHVSRELSCYSPLWRHSKDALMSDFSRPAGSVVADAIRDLVQADGGKLSFAADADVTRAFGNDIWFELGTEKLEAITTMAGWVGCEVLAEPDGSLSMRRRMEPLQRVPSYTFEEGAGCAYRAGVSFDSSRGEILNRVVYYYSDQDTCSREMVELPSASPWSYESIGFHRTEVVKVNEVPSCGLRAAAESYLSEHSGETIHIEIEHVGIPGLRVGDTVRYINARDHDRPIDALCQVVQMDVAALSPGRMTKSKLRVARWQ